MGKITACLALGVALITIAIAQPGFASPAATPSYNIAAYCSRVADAVGGSYVIEKSCRDEERNAMSEIMRRQIPARIRGYCDRVAKAVGGSYVIFSGCVDQELEAASSL